MLNLASSRRIRSVVEISSVMFADKVDARRPLQPRDAIGGHATDMKAISSSERRISPHILFLLFETLDLLDTSNLWKWERGRKSVVVFCLLL
jgi:hypothetical protein